jgi:predicted naringenin-chalcone synthase
MLAPAVVLGRFTATRPRYEVTQERALAWLAAAHAEAEARLEGLDERGRTKFEAKMARIIRRVACGPDRIARRGQSVSDLDAFRWDDDALYSLRSHPHGKGSGARSRAYAEVVDAYFEGAYAGDEFPPDDLIHVTCTGYAAPNGAQKLVAAKRWPTRVTNAYHMGCYASIPALRMSSGFLAAGARRVEVAHTELCSLHCDPTDHALEQLVVQSLFADGFIRYAVMRDDMTFGLRVLAIHEQLIPSSADAMSWIVGDHGMQMTLARNVPDRVAAAVRGFVLELYARAGMGIDRMRDSVFAVHPGGPKIIDRVRAMLELDDAQVAASRGVLLDYGNMSSATLPHIWMRVLADPRVPPGTLVPSLAFGPGLTVCGALLEKQQ